MNLVVVPERYWQYCDEAIQVHEEEEISIWNFINILKWFILQWQHKVGGFLLKLSDVELCVAL